MSRTMLQIHGRRAENDAEAMSWQCPSDEPDVTCQHPYTMWLKIPLHSMPVMALASVQSGVQLCSTHVMSLRPSHV